jgi:hypothetical protein
MAKSNAMTFTESTSGKDVLEYIQTLFEVDRKLRKKEIQAVVEVNANTFIQNDLQNLFESFRTSIGLIERTKFDFQWLADIMSSVALEEDKKIRAEEYLTKMFSDTIDKKDLKSLIEKVLLLLEREFKKIRSLKQAYYYRNRSVKAIINFLESEEGSALLRVKVTSASETSAWLEKIKVKFTGYEVGEKFTRNSYLSEFEVFLHDSWPALTPSLVFDADKSFNYRVKTALSGPELNTDSSPVLDRAYAQLSSYYEKSVEVKTSSAGRIDLVLEHGAVEFKAVKGEGLYAFYKPKNGDIGLLKDLEAKVLAASFDEESLPDIGTQIVTKPGLLLVIKCLGKPSAQTIKDFERFVSKALH